MSARFSFVLLVGVFLPLLSACDRAQLPVADKAVKQDSGLSEHQPVPVTSPDSIPASIESFVLDTAVKPDDTLASLRKQYGETNVIEGELPGAEGEMAQGWTIFPDSPEKKLMVYTDEAGTKPNSLFVEEANSKWHLANSVKLGTDLKTLQALNKKPFSFYGFYWDYGGVITDWKKGELDGRSANGLHINIHLCPPENENLPDNYLMGDGTFESDHPLAIQFPPVVCRLGVHFPVDQE